MTPEITDEDRATADRLLFAEPRHPIADSERLAFALAKARAAGYAAGLEERADEAHESGYREALERVRHEFGWPDPRGFWRAADAVQAMIDDASVTRS